MLDSTHSYQCGNTLFYCQVNVCAFATRAGQVVYAGPRTGVVPFFESMGFRCPERKAVPDFLQEVNSFKDQAVRVGGLQCRLQRRSALQEAPNLGIFEENTVQWRG